MDNLQLFNLDYTLRLAFDESKLSFSEGDRSSFPDTSPSRDRSYVITYSKTKEKDKYVKIN